MEIGNRKWESLEREFRAQVVIEESQEKRGNRKSWKEGKLGHGNRKHIIQHLHMTEHFLAKEIKGNIIIEYVHINK